MINVLNELLRLLRQRAFPELKLGQVADLLQIQPNYLTKIETGRLNRPDKEILTKIIHTYNLSGDGCYEPILKFLHSTEGNPSTPTSYHIRGLEIPNSYPWPIYVPLQCRDIFDDQLSSHHGFEPMGHKFRTINTSLQLSKFDFDQINSTGDSHLIIGYGSALNALLKLKPDPRIDLYCKFREEINRGRLMLLAPTASNLRWQDVSLTCLDNLILINRRTFAMRTISPRKDYWGGTFKQIQKSCGGKKRQLAWLKRLYLNILEWNGHAELTDIAFKKRPKPDQGEAAAPEEPS